MKKLNVALLLLFGLIALFPAVLSAQLFGEKDEVIVRYKAALAKNDYEAAVTIVCDAAKTDQKKYEKRCVSAQQDANKQLQKLDGFFNTGKTEFDHKDYAGAVRDLSKVNFGVHKAEAQQLLKDANDALGHPQLLAANKVTLSVAEAAYGRGDFTAARQNAAEIKVVELLPMAQQMLKNIHTYEEAIQQADQALKDHNYAAAQQKYKFALAINANGPGNPNSRLQEIAAAVAAAKGAPATKPDTSATIAVNAGPTDTKKVDASAPTGVNDKLKAALAEAHAAEAGKNNDAAIAAYDRALAINPYLTEALTGKQKLVDALQKDGDALESKLASGISSFYKSHFTESSAALSLYLTAGGTHNKGAAHFYLGATLASEALLSDPQTKVEKKTLHDQALMEFQLARREHYQPVQKYLSPRILALWNESPT